MKNILVGIISLIVCSLMVSSRDNASIGNLNVSTYLKEDQIRYHSPFRNIPANILNDSLLLTFEINPLSDTIYIKQEKLAYSHPRNTPHDYTQLLVWDSQRLVYLDDNKGDLLLLAEKTPSQFKKEYNLFFEFITRWDSSEMGVASENKSHLLNYASPTIISRVIFENGHPTISNIEFTELNLGEHRSVGYYNSYGYENTHHVSYNALIEDILFYRHTYGMTINGYSEKTKELIKKRLVKQRAENKEFMDILYHIHTNDSVILPPENLTFPIAEKQISLYSLLNCLQQKGYKTQSGLEGTSIINNNQVKDFLINTQRDTIFIKTEAKLLGTSSIVYRYLAAWDGQKFIYVSNLPEKKFYGNIEMYDNIRRIKSNFFILVNKWDTTEMRHLELNRLSTSNLNSVISRIIFNNGRFTVESFKFSDLKLPYSEDYKLKKQVETYNPLFEF